MGQEVVDVIDASHFEVIKQFLLKFPWYELKVNRDFAVWNVILRNKKEDGPHSVHRFSTYSLGESLRDASLWVRDQDAIQERETEAVSICETSSNSETLDKKVRGDDLPDDREEEYITRG